MVTGINRAAARVAAGAATAAETAMQRYFDWQLQLNVNLGMFSRHAGAASDR